MLHLPALRMAGSMNSIVSQVGKLGLTIRGVYGEGSGTRGDSVTVTAADFDGYTFRYWVRGSADNGTWMSADKSYTFSLMTNTCLTAVYSEATTDKVVEFFNESLVHIVRELKLL